MKDKRQALFLAASILRDAGLTAAYILVRDELKKSSDCPRFSSIDRLDAVVSAMNDDDRLRIAKRLFCEAA